jgi:hypothetical protein
LEIYNSHCFYFLDIANGAPLQEIPGDQVLCDLSKTFVGGAMYLGVELGLTRETIVQILAKDEKDLFKQNLGVLKEWKFSKQHEATILMLMKAFQWVDGKGLTFLIKKYR